MNKFFRLSLTALALIFVFNVFAVTETKAQIMNTILMRMNEHNKKLQTLQASVKMDKFNSQLSEHDIYEGTTKYATQKKGKALVRIDWAKPREESLAVVKGQYILYTPALSRVFIGNVDSAKSKNKGANSALAFMNMSKAELQKNYIVQYIGLEAVNGSVDTWHILLTPKTAQSYKTADLWIDANGMPLQARVTESNNDTTTVSLSNLRKNETLNAAKDFTIAYPKSIKPTKG